METWHIPYIWEKNSGKIKDVGTTWEYLRILLKVATGSTVPTIFFKNYINYIFLLLVNVLFVVILRF